MDEFEEVLGVMREHIWRAAGFPGGQGLAAGQAEKDFGEAVAARLRAGNREEYAKLQNFVRVAVQRQEWVYADMIMRVFWALLPEEAQKQISQ